MPQAAEIGLDLLLPAIDAIVTSKPAFVKTVYGSASSLIHNPVGCSPIWPADVLTRRTFLAILVFVSLRSGGVACLYPP